MRNSAQFAGAEKALEKSAIAPWALPAGFAALGLYGAQGDIREGLSRGSIGQTAWGAAQIPMSFMGTGAIRAGKWAPGMVKKLPWMSKVPGAGVIGGAERGLEAVGRKIVNPAYNGAAKIGINRRNMIKYLGRKPAKFLHGMFGRKAMGPMVGITGAYALGSTLFGGGGGGGGEAGGYGQYGDNGQGSYRPGGSQDSYQNVRNVAPHARMLGLPVHGTPGQFTQAME